MQNIINSLFNKSLAYLEVAILSSKTEDTPMYHTSEYLNVTAHLYVHSMELFLKFAICAGTKELPSHGHDLVKLYQEYKKLYPEKEFDIRIPFSDVEYIGYSDEDIAKYKEKYPMDINLQLRYPVGKKGESYSPITKFETDFLELTKKRFLYLHDKINLG